MYRKLSPVNINYKMSNYNHNTFITHKAIEVYDLLSVYPTCDIIDILTEVRELALKYQQFINNRGLYPITENIVEDSDSMLPF